jgi:hypothetical protein
MQIILLPIYAIGVVLIFAFNVFSWVFKILAAVIILVFGGAWVAIIKPAFRGLKRIFVRQN